MIQPISITLNNIVRWQQALTMLGLERCQPIFDAMGLPRPIVEDPQRIALIARNYLKGSLEPAVASVTPDAYIAESRRGLMDTFSQIAADYDQETANALYAWCLRYIVDDNVVVGLSVWRDLFRRLCDLVGKDEFSIAISLGAEVKTRICNIVHSYLASESMQEIRRQIQMARTLPKSQWEDWLEEHMRQVAGQGEILSVTEMALDLVENIVANFRTSQVWANLNSQLSPLKIADLVNWATDQATALGLPGDVIQRLHDHI